MRFESVIIGGAYDSVTHAGRVGREVSSPRNITQLLRQWADGDASALERLLPLVEAELRSLASRYMRDERPGHTLQTTALFNEAYLRIVEQKRVRWHSRAHFFGIAAILMRRILIDHAKSCGRRKRGGGAQKISLSGVSLVSPEKAAELVELDEALNRLEEVDERKARIVLLKYFGGLGIKEIASLLNVAPSTVSLEWKLAKAWLKDEMSHEK